MSESSSSPVLSRRQALLLSAAAGAAALTQTASASDSTKTATHQEPGDLTTPDSAVANTQYGKVRGYLDGGVLTFKGVPYGADTGGANRWLPAQPPKSWTGIRPTLAYGPNCPQTPHPWHRVEATFLLDWDDGYNGEDMLKLNIWTAGLTGKRPVMVYLHGGGFSFGSSYELPSHEGAQTARHHDVVQVSVNHRLNALGFLDLSEIGGPSYADSANVGMTDLVASLKWVKDNIANFGGDPDNVMIFGQSGGASKVTTLMGMPSAAGLFHRAAVQSGGGGNIPDSQQSRALSRQLMIELGLQPNDIAGLQKIEWSKLYEAGQVAVRKVNGPSNAPSGTGIPAARAPRAGWGPTLDGRIVTVRSFYDVAPEVSKNVPLLIGSVSEEGVPNAMDFDANPTEAEWRAAVAKIYGADKANQLADAMKKAYPDKTIPKLAFRVNGLGQRNSVQRIVKLKYEQKGAPVYQYWFTWQTKQLDGRPGAWHTSELAFCFDNTKRGEQATGNTPEAQALAKKVSTAWTNFARTGNPSQPGLQWMPSDPTKCQTMVLDNNTRMVDDPDGAVRKIMLG